MIKLIASDMDGTLLNSKHVISDENLEAISYANSKGVTFAIATGRDYSLVEPVLKEYNLNCQCIVMNGAEYRDVNGEVVQSISINKDVVKSIIDILHRSNLSADMLTSDGLYTSDKDLYEITSRERKKSFMASMTEEEIKAFDKNFGHIFKPKYIKDIDLFINSNIKIYKIITFNKDEEIINAVKKDLKEIKELNVESTFSTDIEITDSNATKGKILAKVIEGMGLERDEVMILGDSFNDYSMFEEFKNSFAMGNAITEVKEIATYITDTNDNAGVAKAIYKMVE